jgi:hypothetical protein
MQVKDVGARIALSKGQRQVNLHPSSPDFRGPSIKPDIDNDFLFNTLG